MRNYLIGLFTGIAAGALYFSGPAYSWFVWILFIPGIAMTSFGLDVLFGSFEENQPRAAWMGGALFGGPGVVLLALAWMIGF